MTRLLIIGAHPDDAEFHAGALAVRTRRLGGEVKLVSASNGGAGHHRKSTEELIAVRAGEAAEAGAVIGCEYAVWDFPDGRLQPTLELRERIIREIRRFQPDLVLTHRLCDYHPDHRAVGQAVQDASYLVTVPLICPDTPHLKRDPVVACMSDLFTKPYPLQLDVVLDAQPERATIVAMLSRHASQFFEFLPYNHQRGEPPEGAEDRLAWLDAWYAEIVFQRAERWRERLPSAARDWTFVEGYEMSEYAANASAERLAELFPGGVIGGRS